MPNDNLIIKRFDAADQAEQQAGKALEDLLLQNFKNPVLLLLSGGSALKILDEIDEKALAERLTIAMLDERFSEDPAANNFTQLQNTDFYMKALEKDVNFIGTLPRKGDTLKTLAERYEGALNGWRQENPQGKVIGVLGMGPDGHTAGIFPFPGDKKKFDELFLSKRSVVGYDNQGQKLPRERITTTITFLKHVDEAIAFATGKEKGPALQKVLAKDGEVQALPALAWWDMKKVLVFTDIG